MSGDGYHPCRAVGCRRRVRAEFLMCAAHWRMVPAALQAEVYRTLGAVGPDDAPAGNLDYVRAARAAVDAVAEADGTDKGQNLFKSLQDQLES